MGERMASHFESIVDNPFHQIGIGFRIAANDEKGRRNAICLEDVKDPRRPFGVGSVVKGERDFLLCGAKLPDNIAGRQFGIGFVIDVARIAIDFERPATRLRLPQVCKCCSRAATPLTQP